MSSENFQKHGISIGLATPLTQSYMARRHSQSQKQPSKPVTQVEKKLEEIEPARPRVRRRSELRLIELIDKRNREVK